MNGMALAKAIADAVLYEGYLLYPYRASAMKNQLRWQWGVLMPPSFSGGGEHADSRAELLMVPSPAATLHVRLRFLHLQSRIVEVPDGAGHRAVPSVTVAGREHTTWEEAVEQEVDVEVGVADLAERGTRVPFEVDGGGEVEEIGDGARLVRTRWSLRGELRLRADSVPGQPGVLRLRVWVPGSGRWGCAGRWGWCCTPTRCWVRDRRPAPRGSCVGTGTRSRSTRGWPSSRPPRCWAGARRGVCPSDRTVARGRCFSLREGGHGCRDTGSSLRNTVTRR